MGEHGTIRGQKRLTERVVINALAPMLHLAAKLRACPAPRVTAEEGPFFAPDPVVESDVVCIRKYGI